MAEDRARLEKARALISRHDERDADHALVAQFLAKHGFSIIVSCDGTGRAARCRARRRQLCGDDARAAHAPRSRLLRARSSCAARGRACRRRSSRGSATLNSLCAEGLAAGVALEPVAGAQYGHTLDAEIRSACNWFGTHARSGGAPRWQYLEKTLRRILWQQFRPSECGAGRGYYTVGPSGLIYACHKQQNSEIGAVGQRVVIDEARRAQWFDNRFCARSECAQCWARHVCGGACRSESLEFCGGIAQPHAGRCALMRQLVAEALVLSATLPREALLRICPAPERRNSAAISTAGKTLSAARGRPF